MIVSERLNRLQFNHNVPIYYKICTYLSYFHSIEYNRNHLFRLVWNYMLLEKNLHRIMVDTLTETSAKTLEYSLSE